MRRVPGRRLGGSADAIARVLADRLKDELGVTVIVDNRTGSCGQIAADFIKGAPADGTTIRLAKRSPLT